VTLIDHPNVQALTYQVYARGGELLMRSHAAPDEPMATRDGYSDDRLGGDEWLVYRHTDRAESLVINVAQRERERGEMAGDLAWRLVIPMLLGLPLIAGAVWIAVSRALAPMKGLADELAERQASRLAPVLAADAPTEVMPLVDALNGLFERLERSFAAERSFTGDAAHELRTPLAAIRTQAQVALSTASDDRRRHALEQVVASVQRATELLEQLLALARLDASSTGPREMVDLGAIAKEVAHELGMRAGARPVDVVTPAGGMPLIEGDALLLHTLASNLVDNALRYSPPGAAVRATVGATDGIVTLDVEDAGPGVAPELRGRVFDRFFRIPGGQPGSGLGLSIARRIVDLHGGTIEAGASTSLGGFRVSVRFPAVKESLSAAA
jgi:two-component system sensor histidine kinase QseC